MNIQPLFDRVLLKPEEDENITKSGIVLPQTSQERPHTATVVAVGTGIDLDNNNVGMVVNVGDKVLYNKYCGVEVKIDKNVYIILRQIDLIGIVK